MMVDLMVRHGLSGMKDSEVVHQLGPGIQKWQGWDRVYRMGPVDIDKTVFLCLRVNDGKVSSFSITSVP